VEGEGECVLLFVILVQDSRATKQSLKVGSLLV
jgi:hypothetical protein